MGGALTRAYVARHVATRMLRELMSRLTDSNGSILITGALGFVGVHLCQALAAAGVGPGRIGGVALDDGPLPVPGMHLLKLNIADEAGVSEVIKTYQPDAIVHLAAIALPSEARENVRAAWRVNFDGTLNLAEAVMAHAPSARFIFAGSAESYGDNAHSKSGPVIEDTPLRPVTIYGATKAAAEIALLQMAVDGLDAVCFRAFNHTGPGQTANYVVSAFAHQVAQIEAGLQARKMSVGNLQAARDFLDVRDVVNVYLRALAHPTFVGGPRVMNIASGGVWKIGDILKRLTDAVEAEIEVVVDPARLRQNDVAMVCGDPTRIQETLGWRPVYSFEQTMEDTLQYWREHLS